MGGGDPATQFGTQAGGFALDVAGHAIGLGGEAGSAIGGFTGLGGAITTIAAPIIQGLLGHGHSQDARKAGERSLDKAFGDVFKAVGIDTANIDNGKDHITNQINPKLADGTLPKYIEALGPAINAISAIGFAGKFGELRSSFDGAGGMATRFLVNLMRTGATAKQGQRAMQVFMLKMTGAKDFGGVMNAYIQKGIGSGNTAAFNSSGSEAMMYGDQYVGGYGTSQTNSGNRAINDTEMNASLDHTAREVQSLGRLYGASPEEIQSAVAQAQQATHQGITEGVQNNRMKRLQKEVGDSGVGSLLKKAGLANTLEAKKLDRENTNQAFNRMDPETAKQLTQWAYGDLSDGRLSREFKKD